jgi:hypothetical protein
LRCRQGWARPASAGQGVGARRCCRGLHVGGAAVGVALGRRSAGGGTGSAAGSGGGSGHGRARAQAAAQGGRRCCRGQCGWWRRSCRGRPVAVVDGFGRPQRCRPRSPPHQKLLSVGGRRWAARLIYPHNLVPVGGFNRD